jgi:hypothetical protein
MSRRERETAVPLDHLSGEQIEIVRRSIHRALVDRAIGLRFLHKMPDPRWAVKEVAALGRLAFWIENREILVPDRVARDVLAQMAAELDEMDEGLIERYEAAIAEHHALHAFLAHFGAPGSAEVGDA